MRNDFLGPRRPEWVAYLRARHRRDQGRANPHSPAYDDGICHGIIPFGAVSVWQSQKAQRLAAALARPLPARCLSCDDVGLLLSVLCPYCHAEHQHLLIPEEWDPAQPLVASCDRGTYRLSVL